MLPDGRLHLQDGPIDCLCRAWGDADEVARAYAQVTDIFPGILPTLCGELALLRTALPSLPPDGPVARAMQAACAPFADRFITPMAAVAGAVADHVLAGDAARHPARPGLRERRRRLSPSISRRARRCAAGWSPTLPRRRWMRSSP